MTGPDPMPWQATVLIICLIVDIFCLYKIIGWEPCINQLRTWGLIIGLGIVIYFTVGQFWYMDPIHYNSYVPQDPDATSHQWGMLIVAAAPGSLIAYILERIDQKNWK